MTYPEIPVIPPLPIPQPPLWVVQLDGVTIIDSSVIFRPNHAQEPPPSIPKSGTLERAKEAELLTREILEGIGDSLEWSEPFTVREPPPSIPKRRALEWSERGRARQMRPAEVTQEEWECLLSEVVECHGPWHGNRATHAAARLTEYREWQGPVGEWVLSGHGRMLLEALRERRKPKPKPRLPVGMLPPRRGR